jgi:two-component system, LytTR family, response regulator
MIKCLVIDDEPLALQQLASYVEKIPYFTLVAQCHGAVEAREIIDKERIDAIFVDINMPDINGMDFVKQLSAPPIVVFTTAYSEYAVDGYKVDAVDYLLKPFGLDDFKRAAAKVKKRYELENSAALSQSNNDDDSIFLKTDHRVIRASIADIRYVEGMSEYLKIYIEGQRPVLMLLSMKRMEERLPSWFMRIHRSYIVNMKRVKEVSRSRVVIDADTILPVGDIYKEALMNYLSQRSLGR